MAPGGISRENRHGLFQNGHRTLCVPTFGEKQSEAMKRSRMGRLLAQNLFAQQPASVQLATFQMPLRRFKYSCRLQERLFKGEEVVFAPTVF